MGKSTISMAMFNSYVSLPEGTHPHIFPVHPLHLCRADCRAHNGLAGRRISTSEAPPGVYGPISPAKMSYLQVSCDLMGTI